MASLEALAGFDHIQEVILQNFVPHRRYYGEEPAEIATDAAERYWAHRALATRRTATRRSGPARSTIEDMVRLVAGDAPADARRRHPGAAEPGRLVAGARRRRAPPTSAGCRPTATTSRPSTRSRRRSRCARGSTGIAALTERLCVYPQYMTSEWIAPRVLDVDPATATARSCRAAARAGVHAGHDRAGPRRRVR